MHVLILQDLRRAYRGFKFGIKPKKKVVLGLMIIAIALKYVVKCLFRLRLVYDSGFISLK